MIERDFDIPFIADLALREKQIQQNYRPVIAVHKWFARRPGTLFRGLLLSEFSDRPLRDSFYVANRFQGLRVCDPFMGGGTPLLEANRLGCDVVGFDINPMSYWVVKEEIQPLDVAAYVQAAYALRESLDKRIGHLYRTACICCGDLVPVKYFLWVKVIPCRECGRDIDLFPGYLVAGNSRHPKNVYVCPKCGQLTESNSRKRPGACRHCATNLRTAGPAKRSRCICEHCGASNSYPDSTLGPPKHRLFAIEYHCPSCRRNHTGRFFKSPDAQDQSHVDEAEKKWAGVHPQHVPDDEIPSGDETNRLHRWGYTQYLQMFNSRQLLGLENSAELVSRTRDARVRNALATNLSDLLRYQNMLCRYDTMALKSLDAFSVHGFPVGLVQCESNILGILEPRRKTCIGSGGWLNIIEKFRKAKSYCEEPFEVRHRGRTKRIVRIKGEWIGDDPGPNDPGPSREVRIACADATSVDLPPASLDAVFTDPPYLGNVQYAELMDFCCVWLRRLVGNGLSPFAKMSTRHLQELTANEDMGRGLDHFTEGLSAVFQRMARALKPGSPMVFTYHHNDMAAYGPVAVAILDSGLTCSGSIPSPAEMGASIHISGTGSSIVDTVFVCRSTGRVPAKWIVDSPAAVGALVLDDLESLQAANVNPTQGDARCIAYGHLIRLAIWSLRKNWRKELPVGDRLARVSAWIEEFGGWPEVADHLHKETDRHLDMPLFAVRETKRTYGVENGEIPF